MTRDDWDLGMTGTTRDDKGRLGMSGMTKDDWDD